MQVADVVSENVTEVNIGIAKVIEVEGVVSDDNEATLDAPRVISSTIQRDENIDVDSSVTATDPYIETNQC